MAADSPQLALKRSVSLLEQKFGSLDAYQDAPDFWPSTLEAGATVIESLNQAEVRVMGQSVAGRDIVCLAYGDFESLHTTTDNLHSAIASKLVPVDETRIYPEGFFGDKRRRKPVVMLQGPLHGGELTGAVVLLNVAHIVETGVDLRGKAWPRLAELASRVRLCLVPWLNPDATAGWPIVNPTGAPHALCAAASLGLDLQGDVLPHGQTKSRQPLCLDEVGYLGTYYNDRGVNLQYDFMAMDRQPETRAWMECYLRERPDGVVAMHCNAGSMLGPSSYYLPRGVHAEIDRVAGAVSARLRRENVGWPVNRMSWQTPGMGTAFFDQITAIYHTCGATPLLCELPIGSAEYAMSLDMMLDVGLWTVEEVLAYALSEGLRAYETWDKVHLDS